VPIRYESIAYGTRQEIIDLLNDNLGAQRSERRKAEARKALEEINAGDNSVTFGHTTYLVEE